MSDSRRTLLETETGTVTEIASAAGTIEIEERAVTATEDETAEPTDHDHETDATTRTIAPCHLITTDEIVGETETEAAEIGAEDETGIDERALTGMTTEMIVMAITETEDPQSDAAKRTGTRSPSPRRDRDSRRNATPSSPSRMEQDDYDDDIEVEGQDDDGLAAMQAMMGFGGFGTTKGKKVAGNNAGGVRKEKKSEYRQYMNRQGGFNRPLSPSR
ncbi:U4/U6.U5 tri-snRNP-associated protein 3-like protein C162.01c [Trichoderma asperellum]|uniref:U4/U6.U5 tri-snRNP-associated protein 3-like protein C162.01c n=1 Tax=Trichoderma asperellum TaxID=101201 RepID=A0A6V8QSC2_TRIAP|nr:U4/U6.U5 tri-snRNP-associated protein 3-like protein C162.01c [Trichoderma asperellum]